MCPISFCLRACLVHDLVPLAAMACCIPAPPAEHLAAGKEESWGGIDVYVNHPELVTAPTSAVVLVSDVFGSGTPLLRKLADKVAAAGFLVVVPDLLYGDPYKPGGGTVFTWLPSHRPEGKPLEDAKKLVQVLRSKGCDHIGIGGFCWGAKIAASLAQGTEVSSAVMCHPSFVTVEEVKAVKQPTAILAAETDDYTPVKLALEFKTILAQLENESLVKVFPGTSHGWVVRYDVSDEAAVKKAGEAHDDMINWFKKTLGASPPKAIALPRK